MKVTTEIWPSPNIHGVTSAQLGVAYVLERFRTWIMWCHMVILVISCHLFESNKLYHNGIACVSDPVAYLWRCPCKWAMRFAQAKGPKIILIGIKGNAELVFFLGYFDVGADCWTNWNNRFVPYQIICIMAVPLMYCMLMQSMMFGPFICLGERCGGLIRAAKSNIILGLQI